MNRSRKGIGKAWVIFKTVRKEEQAPKSKSNNTTRSIFCVKEYSRGSNSGKVFKYILQRRNQIFLHFFKQAFHFQNFQQQWLLETKMEKRNNYY